MMNCCYMQEFIQSPAEYKLRSKLATLVQGLVQVLKSSNTILPCAHWYTSKLKQLLTTRSDSLGALSLPGNKVVEFPHGLSKLAQGSSVLTPGTQGRCVCGRGILGTLRTHKFRIFKTKIN